MPWLATTGPSILYATLFAVGLLGLSVAVGHRVLGWFGVPAVGSLRERLFAAVALGVGVLGLVPVTLGALGLFRLAWLRAAFALLACIALRDAVQVVSAVRRAYAERASAAGWMKAWLFALIPGLFIAFLLAVTPTIDADGLGYHLTVPKRWLSQGSLAYIPTYPNSNMPMGVEMLFTIGLAFGGDASAKVVHFSLGTLGAFGLYLAGKRLAGSGVGAAAALVYLYGPVPVAGLLGWAYVEGLTSFAVIGSALAWIAWYQQRSAGWLRVAAALAGLGVSFKITSGLFPLALAALTLITLSEERRRGTRSTLAGVQAALAPRSLLVLGALVALPVSPWLIRAAIVTGNPVFPMFARWIPSRDFTPELAAQWEHFNRYMNWAISVGASWSLEDRKLILLAVALGVVIATAMIYWMLSSRMSRGVLLVMAGTVLVQIAAVGIYVRYWIPLFSVLQLPVLAWIGRWLEGRTPRLALVGVTVIASLVHARRGLAEVAFDTKQLVQTALGFADKGAFIQRFIPLYPLYTHANQTLPEDSRILLAYHCASFYIDASTFCADTLQGALRLTNWPEFSDDLRRLGITHVIAPRALATGGPRPPTDPAGVAFMVRDREYELVSQLLMRSGDLLLAAADQGLYELDLAKSQ